jgi:hypothetical protein
VGSLCVMWGTGGARERRWPFAGSTGVVMPLRCWSGSLRSGGGGERSDVCERSHKCLSAQAQRAGGCMVERRVRTTLPRSRGANATPSRSATRASPLRIGRVRVSAPVVQPDQREVGRVMSEERGQRVGLLGSTFMAALQPSTVRSSVRQISHSRSILAYYRLTRVADRWCERRT